MNPVRRCLMALILMCPALGAVRPALAGPPLLPEDPHAGASRVVGREEGEGEQIERRVEWFLSTRRRGVAGPGEMARLRREAAFDVAARLAGQKSRREAGALAADNYWVSLGPAASHFGGWAFGDVSGRITGIARDSAGAIYISSAAGGVWKTVNGGLSWTNLFENAGTQPTGALAVDPNDSQVIWVGTGDFATGCEGYFGIGMLRSADGGATWESRNGAGAGALDDVSAFSSVVIDPRNSSRIVAGGVIRGCTSGQQMSGGLYVTSDGGQTWSKKISGTPVHEIAQDQGNRDIFWAATEQGIFKSTDSGQTWNKQTASGLPSSGTGRTELAVSPADGNYVYALFGSPNEFWRTTNGGASWTRMSSGNDACDGQCWYNMTLAVHRTSPNVVYRGNILIYKSTNGGANWTALTNGWGSSQQVHQDIHALLVDPVAPNKFYVGGDGGMWSSADGGGTFVNMNAGLNLFLFYAIDGQQSAPGVVCGGAQDNSSLVRTTGNVWDLQAVTGDGFICAIDPTDPNYAYITSYPGSYPVVNRSTNGVLGSFSNITGPGSGINSGDRIAWVTPYTLDPNTPRTLLLGTHRIYRSVDHGSLWSPVGPADMTRAGGTLAVVEFNRSDSRVAYAGSSDGKIWRTPDNGINWSDITSNLPDFPVNDVAGDPEDPARALAVLGGFNHAHLYEWQAGRGSWVALGGGLPNVPANTVLMKTGTEIYVGTDVGIFRSTDGGATFDPFMNGLPQGLVVTDLKFNRQANLLTAGTYGRGAYQISVDPPGPIVMYDSVVLPLTPLDGDGDAAVEPGETWQATPVLRNAGGLPARQVKARLTTAASGVTVEGAGRLDFGTIEAGGTAAALAPLTFIVDPSFPCGGQIVFDLSEVASLDPAKAYPEQPGVFSVTVADHFEEPLGVTVLDEDFDPIPAVGWTHQAIQVQQLSCLGIQYKDEWRYSTKDAARGASLHCGKGPGKTYANYNHAWLYFNGRDSIDGAGLLIPADVIAAELTLVHWYKTQGGADAGQVVIDSLEDGQDNYIPLVPAGGYPGSQASGNCNPQENREGFTGTSGGWVTSSFDMTPFIGRRVYLAFVFGSDKQSTSDEGWYIDRVRVEGLTRGTPVCQVTSWAGRVPPASRFSGAGAGRVQAEWSPACNSAQVPGQTYSLQAGNLENLVQGGVYGHAPVENRCDLSSPWIFTPGTGNQYFLLVANLGGREGSAGGSSSGQPRPQTSTLCGTRREGSCP